MNSTTKKLLLVAVLIAGLVVANKLSDRTSRNGSSCGSSTCITPTAAPDKAAVGGGGLPKLIEFGSTACMPCKMMAPILEELEKEYKGKLIVEPVDISENREAAAEHRIRAIPTQIFVDESGKEFFRHQGFLPKEEILAAFKEHGIDLGRGSK